MFSDMFRNHLLMNALLAWATAQILKFIIYFHIPFELRVCFSSISDGKSILTKIHIGEFTTNPYCII